ncbi:MAG TPA: S8 family serine peptidase [Anaerolineae bacterium]|nr:S8 family serine peptidase [Anaerolineae bacterium]
MKRAHWFRVSLIAVLAIVSLGAGLASSAQGPATGFAASASIEPQLQAVLDSEGQANLFVMFRDQADLSAAYGMSWEARGEYVWRALVEVAAHSQARVRAALDAQRIAYESFPINNSIYIAQANQTVASNLLGFPEVAYLRLERQLPVPQPVMTDGAQPVPDATTAWGLTDTKATSVWSLGYQGSGIKVANIDTGVQYSHPALDQAYACAANPSDSKCWYDPYGTYSTPADGNGHGTHTMGTMVADDDPSLTYIAGMAPDATWIACRGCSTSSCSDSALTSCANWILQPGGNTANRPHIVNNSWGGGGGDTWYQSYVTAWVAAAIFPAFSAGNEGSSCSTLGSPGDYQVSFATAAHDSSRTIASFSSRGPSAFGHDPYTKPNISGPGVSICSTIPGSSWSCSYSGTSMSSPHTAGAVALLWQACPAYKGNIDGTFQLLQSNSDTPPAGNCGSPGDGGNYTYGYGYLNVLAALNACGGGGPTPTPAPTSTPAPVQPILLVDDDANASYQTYFTAALNTLGRGFDTWTVYSQGSPSAATLQAHQVVIWFTGNDYSTTLTTTDIANLTTYLSGGGRLFITGQDIGYDINTNAFYANYLHASYIADDTNVTTLIGTDVMAGADVTITGGDGASNQSYPSAIGLGSGAVGLYDYTGTAYTWGALRWEGAYRVVYFSFGFEGISAAATRAAVMDKVLAWLEGGVTPPTPTTAPTNTPVPPTNTPTNTPPPGPTNTPAPTATPTPPPAPGGETIWLSLTANTGSWNDEDIVELDPTTGSYYWVFDGSDVGITTDIDAFDVLDNGHILMSFDASTSVAGVGTVGDADVVEFTPTSLGSTTAGTFAWKLDGSDVGLSDTYEDIDALFMLADGSMVVSVRDAFSVTGITGQDEDLIRFTATSWGSTTAGTWSWYFDGSDVGLSTSAYEDVDGAWLDTAITPYPHIYLTTYGSFSVSGISGANEDIFVFRPTVLGSTTAGSFNTTLYLDGSAFNLSSYDVDAFDLRR